MNTRLRIGTLFQTIEKLNTQRQSQKLSQDDIGQLRYTISKILQLVASQEKPQRDTLLKHHIETILAIFDMTTDSGVILNVVLLLLEFLGKTHTGKRASLLVSNGASQVLLHALVRVSREGDDTDLLMTIHQLLAKLAPKDRKIGVRSRLSHALPVTLNLTRDISMGMKLLHPVLIVLKYISSNSVNASYIGKNGGISYLFRILNYCNRKHLAALKTALDTLVQLVKSKSNSARAIGQGGVGILLTMFFDWHRFDSKNRHVNLRKSILNVLKNVTNLKSGQKALKEADGIRILYTACQETMEVRELEGLIFTASVIMRKCFPKNKLPTSTLRSVLNYNLPESDFHVLEAISEDGSGLAGDARNGDGDDSSLDNDDDISSDDDAESRKIEAEMSDPVQREQILNQIYSELEDNTDETSGEPPYRRTADELIAMYEKFFPEQIEFEATSSDSDDNQSDFLPSSNTSSAMRHHPSSSPCLGSYQRQDMLSSASSQSRVTTGFEGSVTDDGGLVGPQNLRPKFLTGLLSDRRSEGASQNEVSAVNLKTGAPVFSLDFSPKASRRMQSPKPRGKKSNGKSRLKGRPKSGTRLSKKQEDTSNEDVSLSFVTDSITNSIDELSLSAAEDEEEDGSIYEMQEVFEEFSARTESAGRFSKLAYPDIHAHKSPPFSENLYDRKFGVQRAKIFEDIDRMIHPDQVIDRVVYDLDNIVEQAGPTYTNDYSNLTNVDDTRLGKLNDYTDCLQFNSQFECGNLRKAIQVRPREYDLILNPDVNTNHHHQWFYFEVSNMEADVPYRFNIINCEKLNSQFNFGMRPLMYSVTEAVDGRPYWLRVGSKICYYRNHFVRSSQTTGGVRGKAYYTTTFTITFKHEADVCYLAYHYPYTYTMMKAHIYKWENIYNCETIFFRHQTLCDTISGNAVPVLTITAMPQSYSSSSIDQLKNRPYIFLSSRVHPGESNASWVMKGSIQFLLSDKPMAQNLREMYIFKIVPMLNPDGVINGNHRCSLTAEDLNRRWLHPCPKLHPSIYHCKGLLQYMKTVGRTPLVYCDYHGHSRRKNVFIYGCSPGMTWQPEDWDNPAMLPNKLEDSGYKTLPRYLNQTTPQFSWSNCSFMVEKSKESTARVVVWRQIGVVRSYTMESTFCGCDQGLYKGNHIGIKEMEEMGRKFCEGLVKVKSRHSRSEVDASLMDVPSKSSPIDSPQEGTSTMCDDESGKAAQAVSITENSDTSSDSDMDEDEELDPDNLDG